MAAKSFNPFQVGLRLINGFKLNELFTGGMQALIAIQAGRSASSVLPEGVLIINTTSTGNGADTTEDTLMTFSLPANVFGAQVPSSGQGFPALRIKAWGTTAANTDNKTMRLYFGSEVVATPAAATNNKNWSLELVVIRTGASTQVVFGNGLVDVTPVTGYVATGAETETAAITIKLTGQAGTGNANDIVAKGLIVEVLN